MMRWRKVLISAVAAIVLLLPTFSFADEEEGNGGEEQQTTTTEKKKEFLSFDINGFYRLRWTRISDMDVYAGGTVPRVRYWDQRWRIEPVIKIQPNLWMLKSVTLHTMADIWDGSFGIDDPRGPNLALDLRTWDQPYLAENRDWKEDGFWWREYWGEIDLTFAIIRVGRMSSPWGRGILANDGYGYKNDFGDEFFGSIVDRVLLATKPIDLVTLGKRKTDIILAIAYDWLVVNDPTGDEDDDPSEFIVALFKEPEQDNKKLLHDLMAGIYYVNREQDDNTTANVIDMTFRLPVYLMDDALKLVFAFEGVYIWGETDANKSLTAPQGSDISMLGCAGTIAGETKYIDLILEAGYASGDPDPFDDEITDFHFHPDYNVGLILFERVLSAATANTSYQFSSPALLTIPPAGIDLLPTNGAVTNAVYLYPRLKVRPIIKGLEIVMGLLYAYAPQDLVDPYQSFLNGGVATNYNGGPADSDLGWEYDLGVSYTLGNPKKLALRVGGQWGWFFPGKAFDDAYGNSMDKIDLGQFRFDVIY